MGKSPDQLRLKDKDLWLALNLVADSEPDNARIMAQMITEREDSRRPGQLLRSPASAFLAFTLVAFSVVTLIEVTAGQGSQPYIIAMWTLTPILIGLTSWAVVSTILKQPQ